MTRDELLQRYADVERDFRWADLSGAKITQAGIPQLVVALGLVVEP